MAHILHDGIYTRPYNTTCEFLYMLRETHPKGY